MYLIMPPTQPATLYRVDGTTEVMEPNNGKDFKCDELQKIVNGSFEVVFLGGSTRKPMLVINEEGKLNGSQFNLKATELLKGTAYEGDAIYGDALWINPSQMK
jgi:hypothetical protein